MPACPKPTRGKRIEKGTSKVPRQKLFRRIKVKIHDDWSLFVRRRDKHCVLCGTTENLNAHHWIVNAGRSLAARFCVGNGISLCFSCHRFKVHATAAAVYIDKLKDYMIPVHISEDEYQEIAAMVSETADFTMDELQELSAAFDRLLARQGAALGVGPTERLG